MMWLEIVQVVMLVLLLMALWGKGVKASLRRVWLWMYRKTRGLWIGWLTRRKRMYHIGYKARLGLGNTGEWEMVELLIDGAGNILSFGDYHKAAYGGGCCAICWDAGEHPMTGDDESDWREPIPSSDLSVHLIARHGYEWETDMTRMWMGNIAIAEYKRRNHMASGLWKDIALIGEGVAK